MLIHGDNLDALKDPPRLEAEREPWESRLFLDRLRFRPAAEMKLAADGNSISITITAKEIGELDHAVYAWVTSQGEPLRIGTSQHAVAKRLRSYAVYINRSLAGQGGATPHWEALEWKRLLVHHRCLLAVVHQPAEYLSVAGLIRPCLDVERHLIRDFKPPLNRSHR